jgi:hypothetical protein
MKQINYLILHCQIYFSTLTVTSETREKRGANKISNPFSRMPTSYVKRLLFSDEQAY